jgi:hypothetical protein
MIWCEVDSDLDPDCRRVLKDELQLLGQALRSGDGGRIREAVTEALRVLTMWGVEVRS